MQYTTYFTKGVILYIENNVCNAKIMIDTERRGSYGYRTKKNLTLLIAGGEVNYCTCIFSEKRKSGLDQ